MTIYRHHDHHDHGHDHHHAHEHVSGAEALAILTYMLDHNRHHADELHDIAHSAEPAEAASEDDPGEEDEPLPETMEIHYDVPGSARKALASAIGEIIGTYPSYQAAPSFAYIIGEYTLDRNGVLIGPRNSQLLLTLDQDGYRTK